MRLAVVAIALGAIIACSPACTTTVPEAGSARGLFMCMCGEKYYVIYENGEIEIMPIEIGTERPTPVDPHDGGYHL